MHRLTYYYKDIVPVDGVNVSNQITLPLASYWLKVLTLAFLLAGCFQSGDVSHQFEDYQQRIVSVQGSVAVAAPLMRVIELPDKRELHKEIPRTTLGLVDSYQLRKCGLFGLIAERNSVLGKVQDQFRNFDYQTQLIDGLEQCLASNLLEEQLKNDLQVILDTKYRYLNDYFSNLILTSDAMRAQLSGHQWLERSKASMAVQVKSSFEVLDETARYILEASSTQGTLTPPPLITPYQEVLEKNNFVGRLAFSLKNSSDWLNVTTKQLIRYDANIVCGKNRDKTKFNYLINVFNNVFAASIQPYLSYLDSEYHTIAQHTVFISTVLEQQTRQKTDLYDIHLIHDEFSLAIKQHVNYWKSLFKRCGKTLQAIRTE